MQTCGDPLAQNTPRRTTGNPLKDGSTRFFVKLGKAWCLQSPCVASPFDRDLAKRSQLVGFLLHPVPQSGTWRRLMFSSAVRPAPGAGFLWSSSAGGRADVEEKSTNQQHLNFTGNRVLSQVQEAGLWINKAFICNVLCGAVEGWRGHFCSPGSASKPNSFFRATGSSEPVLEGRRNGTEFRVTALFHPLDLAPKILVQWPA
jgi:hypothetical protein